MPCWDKKVNYRPTFLSLAVRLTLRYTLSYLHLWFWANKWMNEWMKWMNTADRFRASIRGRPCKNFPSHLVWSPCKLWLLFLKLCARMYRRSQKLEYAGALLPWDGGATDALKHATSPRTCTKFRRSSSNRLGIDRGAKKFRGRWRPAPWDEDVADPKKHARAPHKGKDKGKGACTWYSASS